MNTVVTKPGGMEPEPTTISAVVTDPAVRITLSDGRELSAPLPGFLGWPMPRRRSERIGNWPALGMAFIGQMWMRTISVRALMSRPT